MVSSLPKSSPRVIQSTYGTKSQRENSTTYTPENFENLSIIRDRLVAFCNGTTESIQSAFQQPCTDHRLKYWAQQACKTLARYLARGMQHGKLDILLYFPPASHLDADMQFHSVSVAVAGFLVNFQVFCVKVKVQEADSGTAAQEVIYFGRTQILF
eukprot:scaffold8661_cov78-Skeletonema_dohrnii-CCMP3373.AAC.2